MADKFRNTKGQNEVRENFKLNNYRKKKSLSEKSLQFVEQIQETSQIVPPRWHSQGDGTFPGDETDCK